MNDLIEFVTGDTVARYFRIKGVDNIKSVHFISTDANLNKELLFDEETDTYKLLISSEETRRMVPCLTDYDIKVVGNDNSVYTGKYRTRFRVLPNINGGNN